MKKVINLILAVLTVGTLNAQWTLHETGTSKYTATTEDDGATAVLQNIDSKIAFWLSGLYYCDESPETIVYLYKGDTKLLDKKFKTSIGNDNTSLYIDWNLEADTVFMKALIEAESLIILVYESYCEDSSFGYKITNTKAAIEYLLKP
jgi:hypothetical protein